MTSRRVVVSFALSLLIIQSAAGKTMLVQDQAQPDAQQKPDESLKKKALALVEEVIKDAQALKLPENRIRLQARIADTLWPFDEERARAQFKAAMNSLAEVLGGISDSDPQYQSLQHAFSQIREEMLEIVSRHDVRLALDFLRATRQPVAHRAGRPHGQVDSELNLELRLARMIADKDPGEALRIAEECLNKGIDHEAVNLLSAFHSSNPESATRLAGAIVKKLRSEDLAANQVGLNVAINLLRMGLEAKRAATQSDDAPSLSSAGRFGLSDHIMRELMQMIIDPVMRTLSSDSVKSQMRSGYSFDALRQLQPFMPEIEVYAKAQAAAVRKQIAELERASQAQAGHWNKYNELLQNGTVESLLEASKDAPPEARDGLYQQAAWKALNNGDIEQARRIINDSIADPTQRREMTANIDRNMIWRAIGQEKIDEARTLISNLPTTQEKVNMLTQLATTAIGKDDKRSALQLIDEAQSLVSGKPENYMQMQAQIHVARVSADIDPARSFELIEPAIGQLNELVAAALTLNGFDLQQYFRNGEMILQGGNNLISMVSQYSEMLGALSRNDFSRARSLAEIFSRDELRAVSRLTIARGILADSESGGGIAGGVIMTLPIKRNFQIQYSID